MHSRQRIGKSDMLFTSQKFQNRQRYIIDFKKIDFIVRQKGLLMKVIK